MGEKPNILMIVVDCLRSDRLFSPDRTCRTPNIDKLVDQGTSFPNVFVENSMTAPSFTSIFTGRYTGNHGIIGQVGVKLGENAVTLSEIFTANGYQTYAEVTGPLNPILGIDKGFAHYNYRNQQEYYFTDWGKNLMDRMRNGGFTPPYFLLVHFWEVHVPRQVQPEFDAPEYGATIYDRSLSGLDSYIGDLVHAAGESAAVVFTADHGECVGERPPEDTLLPYFLDKLNLPPVGAAVDEQGDTSVDLMAEAPRLHRFADEISRMAEPSHGKMGLKQRVLMSFSLLLIGIARYRMQLKKGIRSSGRGGFFSNLKEKLSDLMLFLAVARGKPEAAQIQLVKTSLAEHNLQHGYHIYDYLQKVPVVFVKKGIFPTSHRVDTEVRHIDLFPTLIEAFGLEASMDPCDGSSYYGELKNGGGENRSVYLEARGGAQAEKVFLVRGVRRNNQKIAYAPFEDHAPVEFYDLSSDPGEVNNLAENEAVKAEMLRDEAETIVASFTSGSGVTLSATENIEMVKRLKDLGYM